MMLATPPFGASSNIALWRAISKPPVELVVADLICVFIFTGRKVPGGGRDFFDKSKTVIPCRSILCFMAATGMV